MYNVIVILPVKFNISCQFKHTQHITCKVAGWQRMLLFPSDAELQALLQATTAPSRRTRINKCSKCGKPIRGHKKGQCSGRQTT